MTTEFKIPKSGMGITEGTLTKWYKAEGDSFAKDEILAEFETAKAVEELSVPFDGTVQKILLEEDGEAEVLTVIALLDED